MDANIKNLRDALEWLDRDIEGEAEVDGEMSNANAIRVGFIRNMLKKFPLRNCDVGKPEEQKIRFVSWCESHDRECENCPLRTFRDSGNCGFEWMQMPYEAKEGGAAR